MERKVDVLIVGAGPTGLTLALTLAQYGVSFELIDRKDSPSVDSRAIGIQPRTVEVFSRLRMASEILNQARTIQKGNLYFSGQWTAKLEFSSLTTPYPFVTLLRQNETEHILESALRRHGAYIERGRELVSISQFPSSVLAHLSDGSEIEARFLVAADGANSTVRKSLNLPFPGKTFRESWVLADLKADWPISREEVHIFFSAHGVLEVFPLSDETIRITGNLNRPASLTPQELPKWISERAGMNVDVERVDWFSTFNVHNRRAPTFLHHRVLLIGDAAHVNSPVGGQGMNTGIADAFNLGWKLWLHLQHDAPYSLITSYEQERSHAVETVLQTTNFATEMLQVNRPTLLPFQALGADWFTRVNWVNHKITERIAQLHQTYPAKRLPLQRIAVGKIFPELEVIDRESGRRTKISELTDGRFLVLFFGDDDVSKQPLHDFFKRHEAIFSTLHLSSDSRPYVDQGNELAKRLNFRHGVVVIRPDGYLVVKQAHYRLAPVERAVSTYLPRHHESD